MTDEQLNNNDLEFRVIKGYPNYSISNYGHCLNIKTNRYLKPYHSKKGYLCVDLYNIDGGKVKKIHQLVGEQYLDKPSDKHTIDHIDRNKLNNQLSNLRYATNQEQQLNKKPTTIMNGKKVSCGFRGVYKRGQKYIAQKRFDERNVYIGRYDSSVLAGQAFDKYIIANNLPNQTNWPREFYLQPKITLTLKNK